MKFEHKRILITGAGIRLGAVFTEHFASMGAEIGIHCHRSEKEAQDLCQRLGGEKAGHRVLKADLTDPDAVAQLLTRFPKTDILINNASSYGCAPLAEESLTDARHEFEVNFWAPFALIQKFSQQCEGEGVVLNIIDQDVVHAVAAGSAYGLSKKALTDLTRLAANALGTRIRVNGLAPGPVIPPVALPEAHFERVKSLSPLGRTATISDMAAAAEFLIGNASITGQILCVDAGYSLA